MIRVDSENPLIQSGGWGNVCCVLYSVTVVMTTATIIKQLTK